MNASTAVTASNFERDLRYLVTQTIEIMACHGCDRQYSAVSPALTKLLDCSAETVIGQTDLDLASYPQQSAARQAYWRQVADAVTIVLNTGRAERRIQSVPTAAGIAHYETSYTPLRDSQDRLCQILSVSRPIISSHSLVGAEMPGLETASLADVPIAQSSAIDRRNSPSANYPADSLADRPSRQLEPTKLIEPIKLKPKECTKTGRDAQKLESTETGVTQHLADFTQIVLDSIPQYIFWKNREGVYLGSNRRWAEMAGLGDSNNVPGMTDDDLPWTPEQKDWYRKCDRQVIDTNTPMLRIKQSQRQGNGQLSWRETSKFPLHDTEGNVVGLLGTIEDITERKIAEDLLKQSVATFRKLAKQSELLNRLSTQIRQSLKLESIQQTTVDEVRQLLTVERALIYRFSENWNGQVAVESVAEGCSSILGDTGVNNQFHQQLVPQYQQGQVHAIANTATTELDKHHQNYLIRLGVVANLIVPILVQDTLWGLLIVHQCSECRNWKAHEIDLLKTLAAQVGVAIHQSSLLAQANNSATVAEEKAQQLESTLETLKQAQAQLVQTEKMSGLGQMVAGIAHEINNPVSFIYGNLEYIDSYTQDLLRIVQLYETHYPEPCKVIQEAIEELELDFVREDLKKTIQSTKTGTERIREIILSLRNFSRTDEAGRKTVDIHQGIDSTLLILQHRLKAQPDRPAIAVVRDFGDLPPIACFAGQLNQVFMNILANAIDALESELQKNPNAKKTPQITLRTESYDERIIVSISDNGTGIPPAVRNRIFDPFFTTKEVGKGTGMGMAISYQIVVEKHHGQIECLSEEGIGTKFVITVPIRNCSERTRP
ncbi:PAS fold family [Synechococcus sp. PCC 7335]|uniref:ATP-binding protein n=1 Tax=Synechococcus sp. (strain ATCC 29403 / PCC 7335) TaxID=91464 RepID=UPI00017EB1A4|nr:ATP-binding protein [Synechococcus sp. PCC 7335]EDX83071.1 PAS fold family [Synechococcus sp. PCC 7335]